MARGKGIEIAGASALPRAAAVAIVCVLAAHTAAAMGGHFDVDDASVLAPGRCQVELWALHGEEARLGHVGPACRVGPVELGLSLERVSGDDGRVNLVGAQIKWVTTLWPQVDAGIAVSALRDTTRGRELYTVYAPVTWSLSRAVQLHANVGGDRNGEGRHTSRLGVAGEWTIDERFTLLGERFRLLDAIATRAGVRIALGEQASIDVSGARISGSGNRVWGLGLTVEFGR
ncbi:MAG TPA: hypothetical protein VFU71_08080 [Burkholderiaceae bacterium]|nr:hypothetical protein [Burkholderiaceae bacterium]